MSTTHVSTGAITYPRPLQFRVEHFGAPLPATEHPPLMLSLRWLGEQWRGRVDLRDAQHVMWITKCERGDNMGLPETIPTRWFFGRQVAIADKCFWQGFALPQRGYIGTTSMDPEVRRAGHSAAWRAQRWGPHRDGRLPGGSRRWRS